MTKEIKNEHLLEDIPGVMGVFCRYFVGNLLNLCILVMICTSLAYTRLPARSKSIYSNFKSLKYTLEESQTEASPGASTYLDFCLRERDTGMAPFSRSKMLNGLTNEACTVMLIGFEPAKQDLLAKLEKSRYELDYLPCLLGAEEGGDELDTPQKREDACTRDLLVARIFLDWLSDLVAHGSVHQGTLGGIYERGYRRLLTVLRDAGAFQGGQDKVQLRDSNICLSVSDMLGAQAVCGLKDGAPGVSITQTLNTWSNLAVRALLYGSRNDRSLLASGLRDFRESLMRSSSHCEEEERGGDATKVTSATAAAAAAAATAVVAVPVAEEYEELLGYVDALARLVEPVHPATREDEIEEDGERNESEVPQDALIAAAAAAAAAGSAAASPSSSIYVSGVGEENPSDSSSSPAGEASQVRGKGTSRATALRPGGAYATGLQRVVSAVLTETSKRRFSSSSNSPTFFATGLGSGSGSPMMMQNGPNFAGVLAQFAAIESDARQRVAEPAWETCPNELCGAWQVQSSTTSTVRIVFQSDGTIDVPGLDSVCRGKEWSFTPGPAHLDTVTFTVLVSDDSGDLKATPHVLKYIGFIDRGQRTEAQLSGRPVVCSGYIQLETASARFRQAGTFSMKTQESQEDSHKH